MIVAYAERKLRDLFGVGEDAALASGRDVVLWRDLPSTRGLRAAIEAYLRDVGILSRLDEQVGAGLPRLFGTLLLLTGRVIALPAPFRTLRHSSTPDVPRSRVTGARREKWRGQCGSSGSACSRAEDEYETPCGGAPVSTAFSRSYGGNASEVSV